jgi:hypothetical protein
VPSALQHALFANLALSAQYLNPSVTLMQQAYRSFGVEITGFLLSAFKTSWIRKVRKGRSNLSKASHGFGTRNGRWSPSLSAGPSVFKRQTRSRRRAPL